VDSAGVTHYGDHVPPEYATQEQHILNSKGYEIDHRDAQKTPQQMAADERKRLEAEQNQTRDKDLLNTYASVQEIVTSARPARAAGGGPDQGDQSISRDLNGRMKKCAPIILRYRPYSDDPKAMPAVAEQTRDLRRH